MKIPLSIEQFKLNTNEHEVSNTAAYQIDWQSMAIILAPGIDSKKGWHKHHCDFQSVPEACLCYFSHHVMLIFILVLLVIVPASLGFSVDDDVTYDSLGNYSYSG